MAEGSASPPFHFLTQDRFGNENSALNFNNSFMIVPADVYFSGDFTISIWIRSFNSTNNIFFDFGTNTTGNGGHNVILGDTAANSPELDVNNDGVSTKQIVSTTKFRDGVWQFLVATLEGTLGSLYLNGIFVGSSELYAPKNILRTYNFLGKGNSNNISSISEIDELRIYNRSLTVTEIIALMKTF